MQSFATRLAAEPPFRIFVRAILGCFNCSVQTRALWELSPRPSYLLGVLAAAEQAQSQGVKEISVVEFGVAGGNGLVALEREAAAVEAATGVGIRVYGFDMGRGLPPLSGDYRDHPDIWKAGDYPQDEAALRARLGARTTLIIGNVRETVGAFFETHKPPPLGFVSFDMDLYSSTRDALRIFTLPGRSMLLHCPLYFDDIDFLFNHRFAGEFLAIDEFNAQSPNVKIDRWYGVRNGRPFPERSFLDKMFVAHDIGEASAQVVLTRAISALPLAG